VEQEIRNITDRIWAPLGDLDDSTFAAATDETLVALRAMPPGPVQRRASAYVVVLDKPA
jgi:hypothetical protein